MNGYGYGNDWAQHFRNQSRNPLRGKQTVGFGTVLGYWTVAELADLLAAKDATMSNLVNRYTEVKDQPHDFSKFLPAYQALLLRYFAARGPAQDAVDSAANSIRPTNAILADKEFKDLLSALNPRWQEYTWSPGDGSIEDLYSQLQAFGATGKTDVPIPQPTPGSDIDFNALKVTTNITHALESAVSAFDAKHLIVYAIVGGVAALWILPKLIALSPLSMIKNRF